MPFIYIYSPSDFVGGLPDEVGASADGTPNFVLTLVSGATPTLIEITDNDLVFDEVDASQSLTNAVTLGGTTYAAGTTINTAYDLLNTSTGHKVTSFHFGGDGYQQGAVAGLASTVPLTAGSSYTFNSERTSHLQNNAYSDFVACFTTDSAIETSGGMVRAADLRVGDMIQTLDHGLQPLRMILTRRLSKAELETKPKLRPIRITAGALGQGLPKRDLLVSPHHRFMTNSPIAKRMFDNPEQLVSAKRLTALPGIYRDDKVETVEYFHLVLDQHEIIFAENAPTESYFCGPMALRGLPPEARLEMETLFPEMVVAGFEPHQARNIPSNKTQTQFVHRHGKNNKPILSVSYAAP